LIHFLNAVLHVDTNVHIHIQDVVILNPYNERDFETDKLSVVDIKAQDEQGRSYQVEIQLALHSGLTSRILYTWSTIYHGLLSKGKDFRGLRPVIAIWLLNESLFADIEAYHLPFGLYDHVHKIVLTDHLRIHLLQLPKWQVEKRSYEEIDRWMYLFKEGQEVDVDDPPVILQTREMRHAMKVLQHFAENEVEYLLYQKRLDAERVEATWKADIEHFKAEAEQAKRREEQERQAKEQERQAKEQERREKERLLELLKKAGIDPNQ
jgi:predicted transposase/invertase (TIGR01784 family)